MLIDALADLGIGAERRDGFPGVWVDGSRKIASIGVGIRRWVTWHGFALNVGADLRGFDRITPCGISGVSMTSVAREGGTADVDRVAEVMLARFLTHFGYRAAVPLSLPAGIDAGRGARMSGEAAAPARRLPPWFKVRAPGGAEFVETRATVKSLGLHTVCEEARCPNIGECWSHRTATFMLLGDTCTRNCAFCAVSHGRPLAVDPHEPATRRRGGGAPRTASRRGDVGQPGRSIRRWRGALRRDGARHQGAPCPRFGSRCWCRTSRATSTPCGR